MVILNTMKSLLRPATSALEGLPESGRRCIIEELPENGRRCII
jgi:hypothetical protein